MEAEAEWGKEAEWGREAEAEWGGNLHIWQEKVNVFWTEQSLEIDQHTAHELFMPHILTATQATMRHNRKA